MTEHSFDHNVCSGVDVRDLLPIGRAPRLRRGDMAVAGIPARRPRAGAAHIDALELQGLAWAFPLHVPDRGLAELELDLPALVVAR